MNFQDRINAVLHHSDMGVDFNAACAWGRQHNVSFILKNRILTAFRVTCP